ncbi:MAG: TdeIII family type II restriction endonuclease [Clostridia bacterium]|nr:TdeIII family type II restriction endonuclease [Clostridia bacterium]
MNIYKKQEIAKIVIRILKSRFDSFPENEAITRNAPFHKAFLEAFSQKFDAAGTNVDSILSMSSWMHGLNTTLGQIFFEETAQILCDGAKRSFLGSEYKIYSEQERIISEIMTDLKNGDKVPSMIDEDLIISENARGHLVNGPNFTADCCFEDESSFVAIELKSVRPNSGETRGEKQKILKAKAALRIMKPNKTIKYYFGFPFDPTSDSDTGFCKESFMNSMIEFSKFCDGREILLADELWSYLSGEENTMQELLCIIRDIATIDFMEKLNIINNHENIINNTKLYREIAKQWFLVDEVCIANNIGNLIASNRREIIKNVNNCPFDINGKYNLRRAKVLLDYIQNNDCD